MIRDAKLGVFCEAASFKCVFFSSAKQKAEYIVQNIHFYVRTHFALHVGVWQSFLFASDSHGSSPRKTPHLGHT